MNILIIGSGGREHALGWKIKQSPLVNDIYFAPGNGGTSALGINIDIKVTEIDKLLNFAIENKINLTVVGSEDPLSMGIVDLFKSKKMMIFGPTKKAARLESSKAWSASFMEKYHIPQPISYTFTNYNKARAFIKQNNIAEFVIKASGLAMGKGVLLPKTKNEAFKAIDNLMIKKEFGEAGTTVVIQEKLIGQEVSLISLSDGTTICPFVSAQDHKRIFNNDKGPNTGGMGTYAPVPFVTKKLLKEIQERILQPTIDGMKKEKCIFKGALFVGLMITQEGPKVLEYNVRFGDPETQSLMMILKSDLLPLLLACIKGTLKNSDIIFFNKTAMCVILASHGYPGIYKKGEMIHGLNKSYGSESQIFHAGTQAQEGDIITNGGRVLGVTVRGKNFTDIMKKTYSIIGHKGVHFKGMIFRTDIGKKATVKLNSTTL